MIVRLKAEQGMPLPLIVNEFQFYDSPIKRGGARQAAHAGQGFNSMIVRLKDTLVVGGNEIKSCFNSMIVRLKEV